MERDRTMLMLLRPHLKQAYRNTQLFSQLQMEIATTGRALEETGRGVCGVHSSGKLAWASARGRHLLSCYGLLRRRKPEHIEEQVTSWIDAHQSQLTGGALDRPLSPLKIAGKDGTLRITAVRDYGMIVLFLHEELTEYSVGALKKLGLSARETDVLSWIAQGKTNAEVGVILSISPRTVQKHLENIYNRLGIESRHAAITLAMETIRSPISFPAIR